MVPYKCYYILPWVTKIGNPKLSATSKTEMTNMYPLFSTVDQSGE